MNINYSTYYILSPLHYLKRSLFKSLVKKNSAFSFIFSLRSVHTCYHRQRCDARESRDVYVHALQVGRKLHDGVHPLAEAAHAL